MRRSHALREHSDAISKSPKYAGGAALKL
jgi:hypothetical protein